MKRAMMAAAIVLVVAGLAPGRAGSQEVGDWKYVQIKLNYWTANYNGEIKLADTSAGGANVSLGETLDLADELGLENPRGIPEIEAQIRFGRKHRMILSYFCVSYQGDEKLDANVDFGGYSFLVGTDFGTEFKFSRLKALYSWSPLMSDVGSLSILGGVENYWWSVGYEGREVSTGIKISKEASLPIPIPVLGIAGELNFPYGFGLYGSFTGMGFHGWEISAGYTDLDLGLRWQYQNFYLGAGYRTIDTMVEARDLEPEIGFRFKHDGFIATAGAQF